MKRLQITIAALLAMIASAAAEPSKKVDRKRAVEIKSVIEEVLQVANTEGKQPLSIECRQILSNRIWTVEMNPSAGPILYDDPEITRCLGGKFSFLEVRGTGHAAWLSPEESVTVTADEQIVSIRLRDFGPKVAEELANQLKGRRRCNVVLDLSDNLGGFFRVGTAVASLFYPKEGFPVAWEIHKNKTYPWVTEQADAWPCPDGRTIMVLVGPETQSVAELLAGWLRYRDPERVRLIGSVTYGKNIFQSQKPIGRYQLAVISGEWLIGDDKGPSVKGGLEPDIETVVPEQRARELLADGGTVASGSR